ncbi:Zinc finger, RING-type [Sesbania bispinosa]|nr:Zinc finger, RING-type [Sesbania bispinosa]
MMRRYQRRKLNLELDLNQTPPLEEPSAPQQQHQQQLIMIDVEAIDDDVIESSPRAFAQAKTNARRNRRRTIVDVDSENQTRATNNDHSGCRRDRSIQRIINSDLYINLEGSSSSLNENARKSPERPEPPKEPVFNCPICMAPLTEEMSTRCGHIFCRKCIRTAINAQGKCPTCRKKVTMRELIRVFLPSAS